MTELFIKLFKSLVLLGYLGSVLRAVGLQFGYLVIVFLYKVLPFFLVISVLNEVFLPSLSVRFQLLSVYVGDTGFPSFCCIFKPTAKASNTNNMKLFKLAIVATVANLVGLATQIPGADAGNYFLNPNISYLLFGLLFTRLGFLEKGTLQKADSYGLMMLGLMLMLPGTLAQVEPMDVVEMIVPLAGLLVIYSLATCVVAIIIGKLVGYSPAVSCAIACTSMIGYPGTEILSNEVCDSLDCDDETRAKALEYIMPKMIVGGFATVTIASVALAGVLAPMIFA